MLGLTPTDRIVRGAPTLTKIHKRFLESQGRQYYLVVDVRRQVPVMATGQWASKSICD